MGQRINIQYSVDIDNLDDEVGRLIEEAHTRYSSLQEAYRSTNGATLSNETLERVDRIRLEMSAIDHRLGDGVSTTEPRTTAAAARRSFGTKR